MFGETLDGRRRSARRAPEPARERAEPRARCSTRPRSALLTEWMDLGGKYYNDPFDAGNGVRVGHRR